MALTIQHQTFVNQAYMQIRAKLGSGAPQPQLDGLVDQLVARGQNAAEKAELAQALQKVFSEAQARGFNVPAAVTAKIGSVTNPQRAPAPPPPREPSPRTSAPASTRHAAPPAPSASQQLNRAFSNLSVASVASNDTPLSDRAFVPSDKANTLVQAARAGRKDFKEAAKYNALFLVEDFDSDSPLHQDAMDAVFVLASISLEQGKPVTVVAFNKPEDGSKQKYENIKDVNTLLNILGEHPWQGVEDEDNDEADISGTLDNELSAFVHDSVKDKKAGREPQPLSIHIVSRGVDTDSTEAYINEPIETLKDAGIGQKHFGMQFVRVGNVAAGKENLEAIDDSKDFVRDQADTIDWADVDATKPDSLKKASMGGYNKKWDKKDA